MLSINLPHWRLLAKIGQSPRMYFYMREFKNSPHSHKWLDFKQQSQGHTKAGIYIMLTVRKDRTSWRHVLCHWCITLVYDVKAGVYSCELPDYILAKLSLFRGDWSDRVTGGPTCYPRGVADWVMAERKYFCLKDSFACMATVLLESLAKMLQ